MALEHRTRRWPHTLAILAGGDARRMGCDKAGLALPDGRRLADLMLELAGRVATSVVVLGDVDPSLFEGISRLSDMRPGQGPLGGLETLLASGIDDRYLVIPCDMPCVPADLLWSLAGRLDHAAAAVVSRDKPMPMALRASCLAVIRAQLDQGQRALQSLLERLDPAVLPLRSVDDAAMINLNTPLDWAAFKTQFRDTGPPRLKGG